MKKPACAIVLCVCALVGPGCDSGGQATDGIAVVVATPQGPVIVPVQAPTPPPQSDFAPFSAAELQLLVAQVQRGEKKFATLTVRERFMLAATVAAHERRKGRD